MKDLHAIIARGEERVIEAINDNFSQVNRKQEHILKSLQKLQSTKEYKQSGIISVCRDKTSPRFSTFSVDNIDFF